MSARKEFENLVELHYASLYRFAFSLARSEDEACDLTQQVFCTWAEKGHQLLDKTKVKTWLFTTLHREFLSRRRKVLRCAEVHLDEQQEEFAEPAPLPSERADRAAILDALGCVDEPFRAAIALFYLEDYTHAEVAKILDVPLGTVKSRISRGILQLQQLLGARQKAPSGKELL